MKFAKALIGNMRLLSLRSLRCSLLAPWHFQMSWHSPKFYQLMLRVVYRVVYLEPSWQNYRKEDLLARGNLSPILMIKLCNLPPAAIIAMFRSVKQPIAGLNGIPKLNERPVMCK